MISNRNLSEKILAKVKALSSFNSKNNFLIGIDGPTASGKTILANQLKDALEGTNYSVNIYQLDWTLGSRKSREGFLSKCEKDIPFPYEADFQMRLALVGSFINSFFSNYKAQIEEKHKSEFELKLKNLYSREDDGECSAKKNLKFSRRNILIFEGHYTLRKEIANFLDINILLLSNKNELIERKIKRAGSYRSPSDVKKYFNLIDEPSFQKHLDLYSANADLIVDNTNPKAPRFLKNIEKTSWKIKPTKDYCINKNLLINSLPSSHFISCSLSEALYKSVHLIISLDKYISKKYQLSLDKISTPIHKYVIRQFNKLNQYFGGKFEIIFPRNSKIFDFVYKKELEGHFFFKLHDIKNEKFFYFTALISKDELNIIYSWNAEWYIFFINRELGNSNNISDYKIINVNSCHANNFVDLKNINVYKPSDRISPFFYNDRKKYFKNIIYSSSQILNNVLKDLINCKNFIFFANFDTYFEQNYFQEFFNNLNCECLLVNNFLIITNLHNANIKSFFLNTRISNLVPEKEFLNFSKDKLSDDDYFFNTQHKLSRIINQTNSLSLIGGYLYTDILPKSNEWGTFVDDVINLLKHSDNDVRDKIFDFLMIYFKEYEYKFKVENLANIFPRSFEKLYAWMQFSAEKSAILASNIYDIKYNSIDIRANFNAASKNNLPFILQASFNAIGQKTSDSNCIIRKGYLNLNDGPNDFCLSVFNEAKIRLFTGEAIPPYGIGIDHINYENDIPLGRASKFLDDCINTQLITHIVIDGSYIITSSPLSRSFNNILDQIASYSLSLIRRHNFRDIDLELVISELNYTSNLNSALILNSNQILCFIKKFYNHIRKQNLNYLVTKNKLFVGNLGTTHHGIDRDEPFVNLADDWLRETYRYNFVSSVLHGTTNTKKIHFTKACKSSHKINIAGNYVIKMIEELKRKKIIISSIMPEKTFFASDNFCKYKISNTKKKAIVSSLERYVYELHSAICNKSLSFSDLNFFTKKKIYVDNDIEDYVRDIFNGYNERFNINYSNKQKSFFSPSLIEYPFSESYKDLILHFISAGCTHFHIDIGKTPFVSRNFLPLEKINYINHLKNKNLNKLLCISSHLMVKNPHLEKVDGYKETYLEFFAKCSDYLLLHRRSFKSDNEFIKSLKIIRMFNCEPGLIIEINQKINDDFFDFLIQHSIKRVTIMGVPIGFGGQLFNAESILKVINLNKYIEKYSYELIIEFDGGLNKKNISLLSGLNINIFAGWSLIKGKNAEESIKNYKNIVEKVIN